MYAIDVKVLIEKKKDVEFAVSEGPVSAIAVFRSNDDDMELVLFDQMYLIFDEIRTAGSQGIELYFKNMCIASIDVSEWREL